MLNILWCFFIIGGVVAGSIFGTMDAVTLAVIDGGKDAVQLAITMLGVVSMWSGILKIAEVSGLIESLAEKMTPLMDFLFPSVPRTHKARQYIATNFVANFLGLGWAAAPAGLLAMKELQKLNQEEDGKASHAMCMFLIVNMSSLQLVTMNILAFRSQYGSENPAEIIGVGIVATLITTIVGIAVGKLIQGRRV
ncbi:MAG: nucleoside recognition domain-containing protein [Bacillota bacterium]